MSIGLICVDSVHLIIMHNSVISKPKMSISYWLQNPERFSGP